jgi:hypothetical protein
MRSTMESEFDQTCTRTRIAAGSISSSGDQVDGATSTVNYACRVRHDLSKGTQESVVAGAPVSIGDWRILLPHSADVAVGDTITIGSDIFEVQEVDEEKSDKLCTVAICTKFSSSAARSD